MALIIALETPRCHCPACGEAIDAAASMSGTFVPEAKANCITVCGFCGEILTFNEDMTVRKPTLAEMTNLQQSNQWGQLQQMIRFVKAHPAPRGRTNAGGPGK